ncbi:MAG: hypothetical protein PVH88_27300 [Ignavibacteria bacterium]|jgi:hypothetical protein
MSKQAILQYYNRIDKYKRHGGTRQESSMRRAFVNLLVTTVSVKTMEIVNLMEEEEGHED